MKRPNAMSGNRDVVPSATNRAEVQEFLATSRELAMKFNHSANRISEHFTEADQVTAFIEMEVSQVFAPASELGTNCGTLLIALDKHIETENRHLISEGIAAWRFFVDRLPRSAATLAGW